MEIKTSYSGVVEFSSVIFSSILSLFFGTWIPLMTTLLVLNLTDVFTGFLKSGKRHGISSNEFTKGIKKKVGQWVLIIVANSIDAVAFDNLPVAKTGVTGVLIGGEGISIVENLAEMGVWGTESVKKYLVQIRKENEDYLEVRLEEKDKNKDEINITIDKS